MKQLLKQLEKFFPLLKNTYQPALLFTIGLLGFYLFQPLSAQRLNQIHYISIGLNLLSITLLIYFNQRKPIFFIVTIFLGYIVLNFLKRKYGEEYILTPEYTNLSIFIALNLIILYFLPTWKLLQRKNIIILLILFSEYAIGEKLAASGISLGSSLGTESYGSLNNLSLLLFDIGFVTIFISFSISGTIVDSALFFVFVEICLSYYYSPSSSGTIIFFGISSLTLFLSICEHLYNITYHDPLTGLYSRNSFMNHAKNFPLKYSIGIILIDDYDRLSKVFGKHSLNSLIKMICLRINQTETEGQIYRYSQEEFVIIFRGENKNEAYDKMEKIRRSIASAEFILKGYKKPIKLTVSGSVSEKKRSDGNAIEVLSRAGKALQKAYQFTQNITSKA